MSVETWGPAEQRRVRLPLCAHSKTVQEVITSGLGIKCHSCVERNPGLHDDQLMLDFVPTPSLTWEGIVCKTSHIAKDTSSNAQTHMTLEGLVARLASGKWAQIGLQGGMLPAQQVPHGDRRLPVWRAHTHGCQVIGGRLALSVGSTLLLAGRGTTFRGTVFTNAPKHPGKDVSPIAETITDTAIICAGADFFGTFQDCTFERCAVHVVHGATVRFDGCKFRRCNPGLVASGAAASATLHRCLLQSCVTAIIAEGSAAVHAVACRVHDAAIGALVTGVGSHAEFDDCLMHGGRAASYAVFVRGATASLVRCGLLGFSEGVYARDATARVEVQESYVHACGPGFVMKAQARGLLRDVDISVDSMRAQLTEPSPAGSAAVMLGGSAPRGPACMQIERCSMNMLAQRECGGVAVCMGSRAAVLLCALRCRGGAAAVRVTGGDSRADSRAALLRCECWSDAVCCVADSGSGCALRADGCTLTGELSGCVAADRAKVALVDTEARGVAAAETCAAVQVEGAHARLLRCRLHTAVCGVAMSGGSVKSNNTHVSHMLPGFAHGRGDNLGPGAGYSCPEGSLTVIGGSVKSCAVGVWVGLQLLSGSHSGPATALLQRVTFAGFGFAVQVTRGCNAQVVHCDFLGRDCEDAAVRAVQPRRLWPSESGEPPAVIAARFTEAGHCQLVRCRFHGNLCDVEADSCVELRIVGCTFRHTYVHEPRAALAAPADTDERWAMASIVTKGRTDIEECEFSHVRLAISARGSGTAVRRCSFEEACAGVLAVEGCTLKMLGCVVRACQYALHAGNRATVAMQDCNCIRVGTVVLAHGGGGVITAKRVVAFEAQRGFALVARTPGATQLKLQECELEATQEGVWLGGAGVTASVFECQLSGSQTGVRVDAAAVARVRESEVSGCTLGIQVGEDLPRMSGACWACCAPNGRGAAADAAALRGLQRSDEGAPGARCPHEGGTAKLIIEGSNVSGCQIGMQISAHGHVDARGNYFGSCESPALLTWRGAQHSRSTFHDCSVDDWGKFPTAVEQLGPCEYGDGVPIEGFEEASELSDMFEDASDGLAGEEFEDASDGLAGEGFDNITEGSEG